MKEANPSNDTRKFTNGLTNNGIHTVRKITSDTQKKTNENYDDTTGTVTKRINNVERSIS